MSSKYDERMTDAPRAQWRLRDIFLFVVLAAFISAGISNLGFFNSITWIVLGTLSLIAFCWTCFNTTRKYGFALITSSVGILLPIGAAMFFWREWIFVAIGILSFLLLITSICFLELSHNNKSPIIIGACITTMVFFGYSLLFLRDISTLYRLRAEFPMESLEDRLEYEKGFESDKWRDYDEPKPPSQSNLEYEEISAHFSLARRVMDLYRIHNKQSEQFVRANGFGVSRMHPSPPSRESIARPPSKNLTFDKMTENEYEYRWDHLRSAVIESDNSAGPNRKTSFHRSQFWSFLKPLDFGYVTEFRQAAGFIPHGFRELDPELDDAGNPWRLRRLQLVSLRRFGESKVYVLDHLPRMDQLTGENAPTRSLTEFETDALKELLGGKEISFREQQDRLWMLGAIRASNTCLQCHQAKNGDMLGAFTYEFHLPAESKVPLNQSDK